MCLLHNFFTLSLGTFFPWEAAPPSSFLSLSKSIIFCSDSFLSCNINAPNRNYISETISLHVFVFVLIRGRACMSFTSSLQGTTEEKIFSYLGILGIPFLQGCLEWKYQAIQVHLSLLLVQVLLSILGALFHFDLYRKRVMYIKPTVTTNTVVQNRNTMCRCSSMQGLPSIVLLVFSWPRWSFVESSPYSSISKKVIFALWLFFRIYFI